VCPRSMHFNEFFDLIPWVDCYCGSLQSHCAMVLLQIWVCFLPSVLCSDGGFGVDTDQRWVLASTEELKNLFVISILLRVLFVSWVGQLSFPYPFSRCLYLDWSMYVFLNV
jgi:uncharacterized membrane protein